MKELSALLLNFKGEIMKRTITVIVLVMAFFLVLPNLFAGGTQEGSSGEGGG